MSYWLWYLFQKGQNCDISYIWKVYRIFIFHQILMHVFSLNWLSRELSVVCRRIFSISYVFGHILNGREQQTPSSKNLGCIILHQILMQLFLQNDHLYGLLIDNFTILFRKGVQITKFRIIWKSYRVLNTWNIKTRQLCKIHQFTVSSKILCPHLLLICTSSTFLVDMLRSYHDSIALWCPFPAI